MKLIMENWRGYLAEGMKTVADLPDDIYIGIQGNEHNDDVDFYYAKKDGYETDPYGDLTGMVSIRRAGETKPTWGKAKSDGPCSDAWIVAGTEASKGWGPLLYDVAIEWATANGGGLTPDRHSVSMDAAKVWDYYLNKRSDVSADQLDDLENSLTDPEDDNCVQVSARDYAGKNWADTPLSKKYTKAPTTITQLEKMGKLINFNETPKL